MSSSALRSTPAQITKSVWPKVHQQSNCQCLLSKLSLSYSVIPLPPPPPPPPPLFLQLCALLRGDYSDTVDKYTIVDCRYPYEYEGGHIEVRMSPPHLVHVLGCEPHLLHHLYTRAHGRLLLISGRSLPFWITSSPPQPTPRKTRGKLSFSIVNSHPRGDLKCLCSFVRLVPCLVIHTIRISCTIHVSLIPVLWLSAGVVSQEKLIGNRMAWNFPLSTILSSTYWRVATRPSMSTILWVDYKWTHCTLPLWLSLSLSLFQQMCTPQAYRLMVDEQHKEQLKHFQKRSKSWNGGDGRRRQPMLRPKRSNSVFYSSSNSSGL